MPASRAASAALERAAKLAADVAEQDTQIGGQGDEGKVKAQTKLNEQLEKAKEKARQGHL